MPLITLTEAMGVDDPAPSWTWAATITLPTKVGGMINRVSVQNLNLPFVNIEPRTRYRGGSHMTFPGASSIGTCTMGLYETQSFIVLSNMLSWQSYITSKTPTSGLNVGCYSLPKDFLGKIYLEYMDGKGNTQLEVSLSCWLMAVADWSLDYHNSTNLIIQSTFAVNNIDYQFTTGGIVIDSPHNSYHGAALGTSVVPATPVTPEPTVPSPISPDIARGTPVPLT